MRKIIDSISIVEIIVFPFQMNFNIQVEIDEMISFHPDNDIYHDDKY